MNKWRGKLYFENLSGFARALDTSIVDNSSIDRRPVNKLMRDDSDIQERLDKQAAKLARRAARSK